MHHGADFIHIAEFYFYFIFIEQYVLMEDRLCKLKFNCLICKYHIYDD